MTRMPWKQGPEADWRGPVYVSLTDFRVHRARDLPRVWATGIRLRRAWPDRPGAVGLWLWAEPFRRRGGSVSVWRSEEDLRAFVRWAPHVEIMRRYRGSGDLESAAWQADSFDSAAAWAEASRRLREEV
jgi:hypothetical protein